MVGLTKHIKYRAQFPGVLVQAFMQHIGAKAVRRLLGALHVVNAQETVVILYKVDTLAFEGRRRVRFKVML